MDMPECQASK